MNGAGNFLLSCLCVLGMHASVYGAGFDGDAEHLKQTRKPMAILKGIGSVDFRITCQQAQTQQYFNQGVALLHGYDSREADRAFYQACRIEPDCPMTWWGLAIANEDNRPLAAFYVGRALKLQETASERERLWIGALNAYLDSGTSEMDRRTFLVTSLDRIITQFPDDLEACAFLVRQLLQNREAGIPLPLTSAADLLIDEIARRNPDHPAHHYKLLLWEGTQPARARISAEQVLRSMPSAARILTAAGRVYSRMERWDEALNCFETSTRATCQRIRRDQACPVEVAGFVENAGLQIDQLALAGRVREAVALCRELIEMPAPESPPPEITDSTPTAHGSRNAGLLPRTTPDPIPATLAQQKLLSILIDYRLSNELLTLASGNYFESEDREIQWRRMHAVGLAHFERRDATAIAVQIERMEQLLTDRFDPALGISRRISPVQVESAIRELRLCEATVRNQRPSLAETMVGDVPADRLANMYLKSGDRATAEKFAREAARRTPSAAYELNLVRIQQSADPASAAAVAAGTRLTTQFPRMDSELRYGRGLSTAEPNDPRSAAESSCWQPSLAPPFRLSDRHGDWLTLEQFRGKRIVLVFYLGAGCPHCIEQLQTFAPLKAEYEQAGLTVIAISTDSVAGLQKTFEVAGAGEAIPFRLVSDERLPTFREFGVYDTRDNEPLHGTILIDPQGRIRWHNIRREPFMATRSLLNEARRVFSLDEAGLRNAASGVSVE